MKHVFVVLFFLTLAFGQDKQPQASSTRIIFASARQGERTMLLDHDDPVQSAYDCMDWVHAHGGGFCELPPAAFATQKKRHDLYRRYHDVLLRVRK
jgi:hypothetical protein